MRSREPDERVGVVLTLKGRSIGFFINSIYKEVLTALIQAMGLSNGQFYCHTWRDYVDEGNENVVHIAAKNIGSRIKFSMVDKPKEIVPYEKFFARSIFVKKGKTSSS